MILIGGGASACRCLPLSHSYERMVDYTLFQAERDHAITPNRSIRSCHLQGSKPPGVVVPRL